MVSKEKIFNLLDGLNELDQRTAYEFIQYLAHRNGGNKLKSEEVVDLFGKNYFIVPD
ncbi:hypothetical protein [Paenibacillus foliorum]|uniref:hypothetical protein n=1 Tax=Paenibacillus foliorum TaxID=2654974 RepID=UPI001490AC59|nr:hypothetical protein [Paenibacillus foliorum]